MIVIAMWSRPSGSRRECEGQALDPVIGSVICTGRWSKSSRNNRGTSKKKKGILRFNQCIITNSRSRNFVSLKCYLVLHLNSLSVLACRDRIP